MPRLLRPLTRAVTYTRWLHLCIPLSVIAIWLFIDRDNPYTVALLVLPFGFIPAMRSAEGAQAQLLLTPAERGTPDASIVVAPSASWADRWRTVCWLEVRLLLAVVALALSSWLPMLMVDLVVLATGHQAVNFLQEVDPQWWYCLLVPVALVVMVAGLIALGELVTMLARLLLGPSPAQRFAALEARNLQLLERTRIARELHDSIGHALTIAVMQAGAARTANDPAFTQRALSAIEDTGRAAMEDLERVLLVLREPAGPAPGRPTLHEADRLLDSARSSGAAVSAEIDSGIEQIPVAVSQEGYRILQESLTNALRHSGPVPVHVRIVIADGRLNLEVRNPLLTTRTIGATPGTGLRGIRERAALLGGSATTGPRGADWTVSAQLPLHRSAS
ncbi:MAG: histidine kinase [Nakamurella sp.]